MRHALTNRRLLVRRTLPWPAFQGVRLTPSTPVLCEGRRPGTSLFGEIYAHYGNFKSAAKPISFNNIDEPHRIMKMMDQIKDGKS